MHDYLREKATPQNSPAFPPRKPLLSLTALREHRLFSRCFQSLSHLTNPAHARASIACRRPEGFDLFRHGAGVPFEDKRGIRSSQMIPQTKRYDIEEIHLRWRLSQPASGIHTETVT